MSNTTKQPPLTLEALVEHDALQTASDTVYMPKGALPALHKALLALAERWEAWADQNYEAFTAQALAVRHRAEELRSLITERDLGGAA